MFREAEGNLWGWWDANKADAVVVTTNGAVRMDGTAVMGRGTALQAKRVVSGIEFRLGRRTVLTGNRVYAFPHWTAHLYLVTMPVKRHWRENADLGIIEASCRQLAELASAMGWARVVMPRPGCGNGRLDWQDVRPVLERYLGDRFLVVNLEAE